MRVLVVLVVLVLLAGAIATWLPGRAAGPVPPVATTPAVALAPHALSTLANPRGGMLAAIEHALAGAQRQVLVLGSLRGAERIAAALVAAHARGVEVQVVAPAAAEGPDEVLRSLPLAGISVAIDAEHHGMSTCLLVLDGGTAILAGTLADAAERDDAGMAWMVQDAEVAGECITTWRTHRAHAQVLGVPVEAQAPAAPERAGPTGAAAPPPPAAAPAPAADDGSPFHTSHRDLDR